MTIDNGLLFLAATGALWLLLRLLWKPRIRPDEHQDQCVPSIARPGGARLSKNDPQPSGFVARIRLTDAGEFVDRCELTDAIYAIRNRRDRAVLVVWYIHGWMHNASESDPDLKRFNKLIADLAASQPCTDEGRHVVGVYLGWEAAVGPSFLRLFTFWNRKAAADRISQSAAVTKVFSAARYARLQRAGAFADRDQTIFIGHSFGARILFTATSQLLVDEIQRSHPGEARWGYQQLGGPADLVLLLNPALEASVFTALHATRRPHEWESIKKTQQPLFLAISSDCDLATRIAFPLGQWLVLAYEQRQRRTLGNYNAYVTHRLEPVSSQQSPEGSFWYDSFRACNLELRCQSRTQPGNPFIVARAPREVIAGHSDIWGDALRGWILAFLLEVARRRNA